MDSSIHQQQSKKWKWTLSNVFGGLLDRCNPSPFAEVYESQLEIPPHYNGVSYLGDIANVTALDTISSLPVRICFCNSESEPDCSYQPPTIKVKKGEAFTVPLVAVDQVNHSVDANIISSLSSQDGGFSEGQQTQTRNKLYQYNIQCVLSSQLRDNKPLCQWSLWKFHAFHTTFVYRVHRLHLPNWISAC